MNRPKDHLTTAVLYLKSSSSSALSASCGMPSQPDCLYQFWCWLGGMVSQPAHPSSLLAHTRGHSVCKSTYSGSVFVGLTGLSLGSQCKAQEAVSLSSDKSAFWGKGRLSMSYYWFQGSSYAAVSWGHQQLYRLPGPWGERAVQALPWPPLWWLLLWPWFLNVAAH